MIRSILIALAALLVSAPMVVAQEVKMTAKASPSVISPGESFIYTVSVEGKGLNSLPSPKRPALAGLEVVGESTSQTVSIVNFDMTIIRNVTYQIQVSPDMKDGEYKIPGAVLTHKGKTYHSDPVTIKIDKNAPPPPSPRTARRRSPFPGMSDGFFGRQRRSIAEDDLFVTLEVDKTEAKVYEPIVATFNFYNAVQIWGQSSYERPRFKGFWVEELPYNGGDTQKTTRIRSNGKSYILTSVQYALIPISSGEIEIDPAQISVSLDPMSGRKNLATEPVTVNVLPHSKEETPDSFLGMVGKYIVTLETDPPPSKTSAGHSVLLRENESVTLKVEISGEGYLKPVPPPIRPVIDGLEVFDPKVSDSLDKSTGRLISTRTIEIPMIAKSEGVKTIPPMEFSWFDPTKKEYVTKKTSPIMVAVAKASSAGSSLRSDLKALAGDIRHIKPDKKLSGGSVTGYREQIWGEPAHRKWWFFAIVLAPLFALPIVSFYAKQKAALLADSAYVRSSAAHKKAIKTIIEAEAALGDSKQFFTLIDKALRGYLGDIWNMPAPSVTRDVALEKMNGQAGGTSVAKMFEEIELGRYAPARAKDRSDLILEMKRILSDLEKKR